MYRGDGDGKAKRLTAKLAKNIREGREEVQLEPQRSI
jgi:hypothetical protein